MTERDVWVDWYRSVVSVCCEIQNLEEALEAKRFSLRNLLRGPLPAIEVDKTNELSHSELVNMGIVELFVLRDMDNEVIEILDQYDDNLAFDDGGDDPGGPIWACALRDLGPDTVAALEQAHLGHRAWGEEFHGYNDSLAQRRALYQVDMLHWCGYKSRGVMYMQRSPGISVHCDTNE